MSKDRRKLSSNRDEASCMPKSLASSLRIADQLLLGLLRSLVLHYKLFHGSHILLEFRNLTFVHLANSSINFLQQLIHVQVNRVALKLLRNERGKTAERSEVGLVVCVDSARR